MSTESGADAVIQMSMVRNSMVQTLTRRTSRAYRLNEPFPMWTRTSPPGAASETTEQAEHESGLLLG